MKPILFNTDMVRAILLGRKTVTRRIMRPQPYCYDLTEPTFWQWKDCQWAEGGIGFPESGVEDHAPYKPGDILYVRETWNTTDDCGLFPPWPSTGVHYMYRADAPESQAAKEAKWRPSIHMPKEAARLFLQVTDVRAERLQSIDEEGAVAEGCVPVVCPDCNGCGGSCPYCHGTGAIEPAMLDFVDTWNSTLKEKDLPLYGWSANPWVWVVAFERIERDSE